MKFRVTIFRPDGSRQERMHTHGSPWVAVCETTSRGHVFDFTECESCGSIREHRFGHREACALAREA